MKNETITIRLENTHKQEVQRRAEEDGRTMSEYLRLLLIKYLERTKR